MNPDIPNPFYTLTMARVYVNQGELDEALRIYQYLTAKTPDREDIRSEMAALEARMPKIPDNWARVADAVESWVRLIMYQDTLRRFQSFQDPSDPSDPAPSAGPPPEAVPLSKPGDRSRTPDVLPDILVDLIPEPSQSEPLWPGTSRPKNSMVEHRMLPKWMKDTG